MTWVSTILRLRVALSTGLTMCHAGELRVYNDKQLVSTTKMLSPVGAMVFGRYGREEHALISILTSGALGEMQLGGLTVLQIERPPATAVAGTHTHWCQLSRRFACRACWLLWT